MLAALLIILMTVIFLLAGLFVACMIFLFDLLKVINTLTFGFGSAKELADFVNKSKKGD